MVKHIVTQRIAAGTFYKLLLVASVTMHLVLTSVAMALVGTGLTSLERPGGEALSTLTAELVLATYLVLGALLMPFWAALFWVSLYPGLWLFSLIWPMVLGYRPVPDTAAGHA